MRNVTFLRIIMICSLALLPTAAAMAEIDARQFQEDLKALTSAPTRAIGSDGYEQAAAYLQEQIQALPGVELRVHEYPVMMPVTHSATLNLPGGSGGKVYPFWPAHIRLNSTPPEGISGRLVYIKDAQLPQIQPAELSGQIAVMETSAGEFWTRASYFGAQAIIVLGSEGMTHVDLRHHDLTVAVNIPRFYLPDGALAEQLRKGEIPGVATLKANVTWESKQAKNLYALVKPAMPLATPSSALMFSVPFDSSGLIPDLAAGAGQAVQAASGLALLRDLSRQPLDRPVMVFFGGADSIQFLATRNMFMALSDAPAMWREEMDDPEVGLKTKQAAVEVDLNRLRELFENPRSLDIIQDRPAIDRIVKIIETDISAAQDDLFRARVTRANEQTPELKQKIKTLTDRQAVLSGLKYAFQRNPDDLDESAATKYMGLAIERLGGKGRQGDKNYREGLAQQYAQRRRQLEDRINLYQWLAGALGLEADPDIRANNSRLIEMVVAIDLSDKGVRIGPLNYGNFQQSSNLSSVQDYRDWFTRQSQAVKEKKPEAQWLADLKNVLDLDPLNGSRAAQSWLCAPLAIGSEMCAAWGVPGMSMITLDDLRLRRDTPADTLENLNVKAILPQLRAVRQIFWNAWNDPKFKGPTELIRQRTSFGGQVVSPAPGRPVPDLPREGFLVTYYHVLNVTKKIPQLRKIPWTLGVRRNEIRNCDAEGYYLFEAIPRLLTDKQPFRQMQLFVVKAYRVEPGSGAITAATDLGKQGGEIKPYVNIEEGERTPTRNVAFNCSEFSLVGLYDPRFMQDLGQVLALDARRNAELQRFDLMLDSQLLAGYVEPGTNIYLLFRYGRVGNRLILLNMPPAGADNAAIEDTKEFGRGFFIPELRNMRPLSLVTAMDFSRLDAIRLAKYKKAGVSSDLVDTLHREAAEQISQAKRIYPENQALELVRSASIFDLLGLYEPDTAADLVRAANGAWSDEARVYSAAQDMARDVIRAAIFLLLLCVPFSFCMERLLIGSPNIYKQIGGMILFFTIMTVALWRFHPAFQISASPLIIILAFMIIFMSIVVISVVYGKFDTELKRIRSGRGSAQSASFARASVLMSAVLLGIANMRKRKFRTALTSITIVLITFAVLCFTSASRYLGTTRLPTGVPADHPGVLMRQRGFRPMPSLVLGNLHAILPGREIVERWWNVNAIDPKDQIHVVATGPIAAAKPAPAAANNETDSAILAAQTDAPVDPSTKPAKAKSAPPRIFAAEAMLGLSKGESDLSAIREVIGQDENGNFKFDRLENGEEKIIYMSAVTARQLKVMEGDSVKVGGIDLEIAGIFDGDEFDQKVLALSGEPIAPLKYSTGALDAGGRKLSEDAAAESLDLDADASASELAGAYEHLSSTQFVIVPKAISQMLPNASLRGVGIRLENEKEVEHVSDELSRRFAVALFAGFDDGVQMVAASNLASVSGAGQVAIPLAIAGLIIFNTMMGSIAERRREIHVYTSLGLAPLHVGALFVAEAMTYGLIGAVFGYVIGQGVGTLMMKLGWLGGITLNYSGTSAMLTMGLILLIVLLSALVPARLASKIAAPSIERNWKVPLPEGDEIMAHLPFTINKTAADGVLAYLEEYFGAHQEGSIGKFSAGQVEAFTFEDELGRSSRGLKTVIWLTPFDLGIRQHLMLLIHPGQFQDIYEVQVVLQRLSGNDGSWYRMNRSFLTELRKQFLQWRSLSPKRMLEYVQESKKLFTEKKEQLAATTSGEQGNSGF